SPGAQSLAPGRGGGFRDSRGDARRPGGGERRQGDLLLRRRRQECPRGAELVAHVLRLTPGWGDEYHHSTPLQELEITGLPAGDYTLTHRVDPLDHWVESDEPNNFTWVQFHLGRVGANAEVSVIASAPCQPLDHLGAGYTAVCETGGNK